MSFNIWDKFEKQNPMVDHQTKKNGIVFSIIITLALVIFETIVAVTKRPSESIAIELNFQYEIWAVALFLIFPDTSYTFLLRHRNKVLSKRVRKNCFRGPGENGLTQV